jgi:hypothetical protein
MPTSLAGSTVDPPRRLAACAIAPASISAWAWLASAASSLAQVESSREAPMNASTVTQPGKGRSSRGAGARLPPSPPSPEDASAGSNSARPGSSPGGSGGGGRSARYFSFALRRVLQGCDRKYAPTPPCTSPSFA